MKKTIAKIAMHLIISGVLINVEQLMLLIGGGKVTSLGRFANISN